MRKGGRKEGRKEARKQRKAEKQEEARRSNEEATKKGRNTHGNPKHRTGTTNTAMPSPLGTGNTIPGTENTDGRPTHHSGNIKPESGN